MRLSDIVVAVLAGMAVIASVWQLERERAGLEIVTVTVGETPVTLVRSRAATAPMPVVVIAHGFAGSQQLMQPFAFTLARAGFLAVTFDFVGHGSHPRPLPADLMGVDGASRTLVDQVREVADFARALPETEGRYALLGHSMATDVLARAVQEGLDPQATVLVSLSSNHITPEAPRNLLAIVGEWEPWLKQEAIEAVAQIAPGEPEEGVTYGDRAEGTARKAVWAEGVEHIGVLYDPGSLTAARDWIAAAFGRDATAEPDRRGPWLGLLFLGLLALVRPASRLLPRVADEPGGAAVGRRTLWALALGPAVLTPLVATWLPGRALPIIVGDYLALHFLVYGLLTAAGMWIAARRGLADLRLRVRAGPLALGALAVAAWGVLGLGLPLERYAFAFWPTPERAVLIPALLAGTLAWFLADEWLTRGGPGRGLRPGAYALTKLCFVLSLVLAVLLDVERLFFLAIVAPVILVFFVIYGVVSRWTMAATNHPWVAAIGLAVALAWAIAASFPLVET